MKLGRLLFLNLMCAILPAYTGIEVNTSINDAFNRGTNEVVGQISWTLSSDDLRTVSSGNPIYIRASFANNVTLSETRVQLDSSDRSVNQPIYLATSVSNPVSTATINASPEAVSIVRWVAGESDIWICIQESSSAWITEGSVKAPNLNNQVSWSIGVSARLSDLTNDQDAPADNANLPFNTRDSAAVEGDYESAVSTLICLDFSNSNVSADNSSDSLLVVDMISFDDAVLLSPGIFNGFAGSNAGIDFGGDTLLARGKLRQCELAVTSQGLGTTTAATLIQHTRNLTLTYQCQSGGNYITTWLGTGSVLTISATQPGFGFTDARFVNSGEPQGTLTIDPASMITINGQELFTSFQLAWEGSDIQTFDMNLDLEIDIMYDWNNPPQPQLDASLLLQTHSGPLDDAPYDGQQQAHRCEPSLTLVPVGSVSFPVTSFDQHRQLWHTDLVNILDLVELLPTSRGQ